MSSVEHPSEADVSSEPNHTEGTTALASAALTYAQHGVAIFPVQPHGKAPAIRKCPDTNDGQTLTEHAAGCPNDGHGFHDATTDLDTIRRWWTERPDANIGIALGANNIFTVDVDGPEGRAALDELEATYQPLPATYQVITGRIEGSGRHHIYFQPDGSIRIPNGKLGHPKLEIKGDGGYVVAPPSIHESGRAYMAQGSWAQIVDPPDWLVTLATKPEPAIPTEPHISTGDDLARRRLDGAAGKVAIAAEGNRNDVLNWAAYTCGRLIAAQRLDHDHTYNTLLHAAQRAGLTNTEILATINSGFTAAKDDPDHDQPAPAILTPLTITPTTIEHTPAGTSSWAPVDAAAYIDGTWEPPQPTHLARNDGTCLFYPGRINLLFGESEAGKGWVALHAIAQALTAGHNVLYIDFEDYPDTIYARLLLLGVNPGPLTDQFAYIRPDHNLDDNARQTLTDTITRLTPSLVILDGVTGAMSLHGLDTNSSTDVDQFYSLLGEPLARTGAAIIFIDHVTKSAENRGKGPIGSQHKRARVSGASYEVVSVQPIAPGRTGKLRLKIDKDRLGAVRASHPAVAGDFVLDSTDRQLTRAVIYAPAEGPFRPTYLMEVVSKALEDAGDVGLGVNAIESLGHSRKGLRDAADMLVKEGFAVREPGPNRSLIHRLLKPFRDPSGAPEPTQVPPTGAPVPPSAPNASGAPVGAHAESGAQVPPHLYKRGHRGTTTADPQTPPRQVPL